MQSKDRESDGSASPHAPGVMSKALALDDLPYSRRALLVPLALLILTIGLWLGEWFFRPNLPAGSHDLFFGMSVFVLELTVLFLSQAFCFGAGWTAGLASADDALQRYCVQAAAGGPAEQREVSSREAMDLHMAVQMKEGNNISKDGPNISRGLQILRDIREQLDDRADCELLDGQNIPNLEKRLLDDLDRALRLLF